MVPIRLVSVEHIKTLEGEGTVSLIFLSITTLSMLISNTAIGCYLHPGCASVMQNQSPGDCRKGQGQSWTLWWRSLEPVGP